MCVHIIVHNCRTQPSTEQFWCFPSYPPDNPCFDTVGWASGRASGL